MRKKDTKKLILYQEFLVAVSISMISVILSLNQADAPVIAVLITISLLLVFLYEQCLLNPIASFIALYVEQRQIRDAVHARRSALWISVICGGAVCFLLLLSAPQLSLLLLKEHIPALVTGLRLLAIVFLVQGFKIYLKAWYVALEKQRVMAQAACLEMIAFSLCFLLQTEHFSLSFHFAWPIASLCGILISILYYLLGDQKYYVPYVAKARRSLKVSDQSDRITKILIQNVWHSFLVAAPFGFSIVELMFIGMSMCKTSELYAVVILSAGLFAITPLSISLPFMARAGYQIRLDVRKGKPIVKQTIKRLFHCVMVAAGFGIAMIPVSAELTGYVLGNAYIVYVQLSAILAILCAMLGYGVMILYVLNLETTGSFYMVIGSFIAYFAMNGLENAAGTTGILMGLAVAVMAEVFLCYTKISNRYENNWMKNLEELILILLCALCAHGAAAGLKLAGLFFHGSGILLLLQWLLTGLLELAIYFWASGIPGLRHPLKKGRVTHAAG